MPFTLLQSRTRDVLDATNALVALAGRQTSESTLQAARERITRALRAYFAVKDTLLLTPLRESNDCAHRAMALRTIEQDLAWREQVRNHQTRWPIAAIRADPGRYRMETQRLARIAERRAAHQEQLLFPMAAEALVVAQRAA